MKKFIFALVVLSFMGLVVGCCGSNCSDGKCCPDKKACDPKAK